MRFLLLVPLTCLACALPPEEPPAPCTTGERGVEIGDLLIDPPPLSDCEGEPVRLSEITCGAKLTLLDVGAASRNICIEATDRYVNDAEFRALRDDGLQIVQIFTTDAVFQPAEPEFCRTYVEEHAIDFDFLIDPFALSDAFGQIHPLSIVIDGEGIVVERWEAEIPEDQALVLTRLLADAEQG